MSTFCFVVGLANLAVGAACRDPHHIYTGFALLALSILFRTLESWLCGE